MTETSLALPNDGGTVSVDVVGDAIVVPGELPTADLIVLAVANHLKLKIENDVSEADVLARYASAGSGADLFKPLGKLTLPKENLGTTFSLQKILGARNSDFDNDDSGSGVGVYLIVEAASPDGEVVALAIGSNDGMTKVLRLAEIGALPWAVAFEQADKKTPRGFFPINMVDRQPADAFPDA
jgi:hypothetical protein